jgi:hypothetical protein
VHATTHRIVETWFDASDDGQAALMALVKEAKRLLELLAFFIQPPGLEIGVLRYDVEAAGGIGGRRPAEFEGEFEVERVAALDRSLDDPHLLGMILCKKKWRCRKFGVLRPDDHEHPERFAADPG